MYPEVTDWRVRAACGPDTAELFFDPTQAEQARALCAACSVRTHCSREAARIRAEYGLWAGGRHRDPAHGRARSGLSDTTVTRICQRVAAGEGMRTLAREYGVDRNTVRQYVRGRCRTTASSRGW